MKGIKKAGIIAGAAVGGVIGGAVAIAGRVTHVKFLEGLGDNIVDSTIMTGEIAGEAASGAAHLAVGKIKKRPGHITAAKRDLKHAGGTVVDNFVTNVKLLAENGGEIAEGIRQKDKRKILNGAKTLGKMAAIGAVTVGAIKIKPDDDDSASNNGNNSNL